MSVNGESICSLYFFNNLEQVPYFITNLFFPFWSLRALRQVYVFLGVSCVWMYNEIRPTWLHSDTSHPVVDDNPILS